MQIQLLLSEGAVDTSLSWLLWIALGFFFLMVVVGWWTSRDAGKSADDLTKLEGVGPKVSKLLNKAGIMSFGDLAKANSADVDKVLDAAGLQMMDSAGWIDQAKLAAKGDMKGLAKLQEQQIGGRKAE